MTPQDKFNEVQGLFKRLSDEMCSVVEAFYLWRALIFSRSTKMVDEEQANRNAKLLTMYKYFFSQAEASLLSTFIIGISKFYDSDPRSLTLQTLIEKLRNYQNDINADILLGLFPNRFNEEEIRKEYKPFDESDVKEIEELRKKNEKVIGDLKTIRNKQRAHTNLEAFSGTLIPNEVEELIKATQKMFNKLQERFGRATTMWDHFQEYAERDVRYLLENIARGEEKRQEDFKKKYGIK